MVVVVPLMPWLFRALVTAALTSLLLLPGRTPARQPERAALVIRLPTMNRRATSTMARMTRKKTGATTANSTRAAARRRRIGRAGRKSMDGLRRVGRSPALRGHGRSTCHKGRSPSGEVKPGRANGAAVARRDGAGGERMFRF